MLLRKLCRSVDGEEDHTKALNSLIHAGVTTVPALLQLPMTEVCSLGDTTLEEARAVLSYVSRRVCPAVTTVCCPTLAWACGGGQGKGGKRGSVCMCMLVCLLDFLFI